MGEIGFKDTHNFANLYNKVGISLGTFANSAGLGSNVIWPSFTLLQLNSDFRPIRPKVHRYLDDEWLSVDLLVDIRPCIVQENGRARKENRVVDNLPNGDRLGRQGDQIRWLQWTDDAGSGFPMGLGQLRLAIRG